MAPGNKTPARLIEIPEITVDRIELTLIGDSSLICHRFSDAEKKKMAAKQQGKAERGKAPKDPQADYKGSFYVDENGHHAFPCSAFKNAGVAACRFVDGLPMTVARGGFFVIGDYAKIIGKPRMREDNVRVGRGVADLRYRAEFPEWRVNVTVDFNPRVLTAEKVINLLNHAGFHVGVGDWRPEKNGNHGRFHVLQK